MSVGLDGLNGMNLCNAEAAMKRELIPLSKEKPEDFEIEHLMSKDFLHTVGLVPAGKLHYFNKGG